jgi:hypothetical protein
VPGVGRDSDLELCRQRQKRLFSAGEKSEKPSLPYICRIFIDIFLDVYRFIDILNYHINIHRPLLLSSYPLFPSQISIFLRIWVIMDMRTKLIVSRNLDFKAVIWRRRETRWIGRRNQLLVGKMFYIFVRPVFSELKDVE